MTKSKWADSPPFDHKGRWKKIVKSIMNTEALTTFPQFVSEMVLFNMDRFLKDFPPITRGKGWSSSIPDKVRKISQQAYVICNYFPHPDDEPLVPVAFKNYFRQNQVCTIGGFRKVRIKKNGSCNVTQAEKDVVTGVQHELSRLIKQRSIMSVVVDEIKNPKVRTTAATKKRKAKKKSVKDFMDLEDSIKDTNG